MNKKFLAAASLMIITLLVSPARLPAQGEEKQAGEKARTGLVILPVIFSMPETGWAGGVGGLFTVRPAGSAPTARPSSLSFYAIYTERKQFEIDLKPEVYLQNERYFLSAELIINKFPNKYWGIGNDVPKSWEENYTPRTLSADLSFQRKLFPAQRLYVGLLYRFEHIKMLKTEKTLAAGGIPGFEGGTTAGAGFIVNWDSRDNVFYPRSGNYFQVKTVFHGGLLGSDYTFSLLDVDLRKYLTLPHRSVLALQTVIQTYSGTAPFYRMSRLGGDATMRGYYKGRYRDRSYLALQAEVRFPVWWRFSGVVFGGFGQVADGLGRLRLEGFKPAVGIGLRFLIAPKEGTNLRIDQAFGRGSSGFYFNANEAF
ncbi:MAG: outer membrane protein assembly factor [Candidatus Aminicenantes bacterium]|nr:outer membrane protein assembly factor [Candidatus Aminicenantes bacterium]